ncbi:methylisocitrate lyase [Legionella oakridgensis]|uniref:2-methylisocitrate lyase n=1 Tax=Legionella oakridgensis TaxID=29423 RepID=A0A0W0X084_9GAMM|nr:methylisocitrate lyase [Legionella oakridgensis]ETO93181.1 methylisocitrate lyase [Legionella oakridgensis RV-2-2007]KTD37984.1 2-methylisocitrate lyase [Legionella oakridgensis]STY20294.1 2-methylisocitrate lyase [Legionella longbeachae]
MSHSMGKIFRTLVQTQAPVQILGTINAYSAMLAEHAGAQAIYLSGAGVANASYGLPDLGMTSLAEVLEDVRRVTQACSLPLLVDVDTGWGHAFNIARTVKLMERTNVAAIHIEDQVIAKRCGHRPNKAVVSMQEMGDRIKAAVDARVDEQFIIMARTDAFANEGMNSAIERALFYIESGADMIFPEALTTLAQYQEFTQHLINVPVLANITEFGKTPLFTRDELKEAGVQLILYPLSAFRAMSHAALHVYHTILKQGTQKTTLDTMQTRDDLYEVLKYRDFEKTLDKIRGEQDGK